jgi:hypothetical protein
MNVVTSMNSDIGLFYVDEALAEPEESGRA